MRAEMPAVGAPVDSNNIKGLKDILMTYNEMTLLCFTKCTTNFNSYRLSPNEESCVENCAEKLMKSNHSMMAVFMEIQARKQEQLRKDALQQQEQPLSNALQQIHTAPGK